MKPQHQEAVVKLSCGSRELLFFMSIKKPMVAAVLAAVAKCRGLWQGFTGSGAAVAHSSADDYFRWSYEFSCTTTPVAPVKGYGRRRRRRLPPCVGDRQAREMLASSFAGCSPDCSPEEEVGHEIDGLAEVFINRFHEQLRRQRVAELQVERKKASPSPLASHAPGDALV